MNEILYNRNLTDKLNSAVTIYSFERNNLARSLDEKFLKVKKNKVFNKY